MCGIAGFFGDGDRTALPAMLAALHHRGPDDRHIVSGERFAIGAARLSIIDVAGGRQPLTNEDGTIVAAQNGELYNFPVLRPALLERGHRLTTCTDTELLPHIWEEAGERLPERIDGMFAVAVWDGRQQVGFLARDRMGKKPLYYWSHGGVLYFASELKAILAVPGFVRRLNLEALHHYLSYKHVPHPLTIFEGVRMLPPAHRLVYRPGSEPVISRYWTALVRTRERRRSGRVGSRRRAADPDAPSRQSPSDVGRAGRFLSERRDRFLADDGARHRSRSVAGQDVHADLRRRGHDAGERTGPPLGAMGGRALRYPSTTRKRFQSTIIRPAFGRSCGHLTNRSPESSPPISFRNGWPGTSRWRLRATALMSSSAATCRIGSLRARRPCPTGCRPIRTGRGEPACSS